MLLPTGAVCHLQLSRFHHRPRRGHPGSRGRPSPPRRDRERHPRPEVRRGAQSSPLGTFSRQRRLAGRPGDDPQSGSLDGAHRSGRAGGDHQDPPATVLLPCRTAHPLGPPTHFASAKALALGKPSSVAPWHGCEQFHSRPDGTAGANADGDLTHSPDYPTASQTCARLVPERLLLHATLTISLSIATAGRHHRSCVPTSRRPHPHLLESGLRRSLSLAHHPWCQHQRPSLRRIRA